MTKFKELREKVVAMAKALDAQEAAAETVERARYLQAKGDGVLGVLDLMDHGRFSCRE